MNGQRWYPYKYGPEPASSQIINPFGNIYNPFNQFKEHFGTEGSPINPAIEYFKTFDNVDRMLQAIIVILLLIIIIDFIGLIFVFAQ